MKGGGIVNAGKEKSRNKENCNQKSHNKEEDRKKEEISFPHNIHTFFGLGKIFSSLFLWSSFIAVFRYYETPF
jgi:hypothetical protein